MITIVNICEAAIVAALQNVIYPNPVTVYPSDANEIKLPIPYIIVHAESAEEQEGPGTGIYKVQVSVRFRSHVKPDSPQFRDSIVVALNNFVYSNPAQALTNAVDGFYVYGFGMIKVNMDVIPEIKAYEYVNSWEITCIPMDWPEGPNAQA